MKAKYYKLSSLSDRFYTPKGRITETERGVLMDWSACGFSMRFFGTEIRFSFAPYHDVMPICAEVILDGVRSLYAIHEQYGVITVMCPLGEHTVTLLRLSEGGVPLICREIRIGASVTPMLLTPPPASDRRLVFFGDSITCGYGNRGVPEGDAFVTWEEDPTVAYAYRTAENLHAEAELVSISGQGIVRNCNGDIGTPIPVFYAWQSRTLETPCAFENQPDAVIVNAGTNDSGGRVSEEAFYQGAKDFLSALRSAYPKAHLVWFYGLMGAPYDRVFRSLEAELRDTDSAFTYVPVAHIYSNPDEVGANGHPSYEGAERGADVLTEALKNLLRW